MKNAAIINRSADKLLIPWAVDRDGKKVQVKDYDRGNPAHARMECPACGRAVRFRKGNAEVRRANHFFHHGEGECPSQRAHEEGSGGEGHWHWAFVRAVAEVAAKGFWGAGNVLTDKTIPGSGLALRPDVFVDRAQGRPLALEVVHHHSVSYEKAMAYEAAGIEVQEFKITPVHIELWDDIISYEERMDNMRGIAASVIHWKTVTASSLRFLGQHATAPAPANRWGSMACGTRMTAPVRAPIAPQPVRTPINPPRVKTLEELQAEWRAQDERRQKDEARRQAFLEMRQKDEAEWQAYQERRKKLMEAEEAARKQREEHQANERTRMIRDFERRMNRNQPTEEELLRQKAEALWAQKWEQAQAQKRTTDGGVGN